MAFNESFSNRRKHNMRLFICCRSSALDREEVITEVPASSATVKAVSGGSLTQFHGFTPQLEDTHVLALNYHKQFLPSSNLFSYFFFL